MKSSNIKLILSLLVVTLVVPHIAIADDLAPLEAHNESSINATGIYSDSNGHKFCLVNQNKKVELKFTVGNHTCTVIKSVIGENLNSSEFLKSDNPGFPFNSSGATEDGEFYYRARWGCDQHGNWGIILDDHTKCEPLIKKCEANSEFKLSLFDSEQRRNCDLVVNVPELEQGQSHSGDNVSINCFHGQLYKGSSQGFTCPPRDFTPPPEISSGDLQGKSVPEESADFPAAYFGLTENGKCAAGEFNFQFNADGNTCKFTKKIDAEYDPGYNTYVSGNSGENKFSVRVGCDQFGTWKVLNHTDVACLPEGSSCQADTNVTLVGRDKTLNKKCKVKFPELPTINNGAIKTVDGSSISCQDGRFGIITGSNANGINCASENVVTDEEAPKDLKCPAVGKLIIPFMNSSDHGVLTCEREFYNVKEASPGSKIFAGNIHKTADRSVAACVNGKWTAQGNTDCFKKYKKQCSLKEINFSFSQGEHTCKVNQSSIITNNYYKSSTFGINPKIDANGNFYSAKIKCNNTTGLWEADPDNESVCRPATAAELESIPRDLGQVADNNNPDSTFSPIDDVEDSDEPERLVLVENEGDDEAGDNDRVTALSVAFGPLRRTPTCNQKNSEKSLSFKKSYEAYLAYHEKLISLTANHNMALTNLKAELESLSSGSAEQEASVQMQGLVAQRNSLQASLDYYLKNDLGINQLKSDLKVALEAAEESALLEHQEVNSGLSTCQLSISNALAIATNGCNQFIIKETCDDDGNNCTQVEEPSPVPGACAAAEMIPFAGELKEEIISKYQYRKMPSVIFDVGLTAHQRNFDRFVRKSIPSGEWSSELISCAENVQKISDYVVHCVTEVSSNFNSQEWDIPVIGNTISDFYLGILGRNPDAAGMHYWSGEFDKLVASGESEQDALNQVRGYILKSNEKMGVEDTPEEIANRENYAQTFGLASIECSNTTCSSDNVSSSDPVSFELFLERARVPELIPFSETEDAQIKVDQLHAMSTELFNKHDFYVATPMGRLEIISQSLEIIETSKEIDQGKVLELQEQMNEVNQLVETMNNNSNTSIGFAMDKNEAITQPSIIDESDNSRAPSSEK